MLLLTVLLILAQNYYVFITVLVFFLVMVSIIVIIVGFKWNCIKQQCRSVISNGYTRVNHHEEGTYYIYRL